MCHMSRVTCHMSCVTCHVSRVTCHMSCVTCHMSHVTCHVSKKKFFLFFFFYRKKMEKSGEASRLRVCYQRGLPRLVLIAFTYMPGIASKVWFILFFKIAFYVFNHMCLCFSNEASCLQRKFLSV